MFDRASRGSMYAIPVLAMAVGIVGGCGSEDERYSVLETRSVALKMEADHFIGRAMDLALSPEGEFYIPDYLNHVVWVFDSTGREIARIGRPGDGPGELRRPVGVAIRGDTLAVLESGNPRISFFRLDRGAFIGTIPQGFGRPSGIEFHPTGDSIAISHSYGGRLLSIIDRGGTVLGSHGDHPDAYYVVPVELPGGHMSLGRDGDLLVSTIRDYRVARYDWSGRTTVVYASSPPEHEPLDLESATSRAEVTDRTMAWTPVGLPLEMGEMVLVQWLEPGPQARSTDLDYRTYLDIYHRDGSLLGSSIPTDCVFQLSDGKRLYCLDSRPMAEGETRHPVLREFRLEGSRSPIVEPG